MMDVFALAKAIPKPTRKFGDVPKFNISQYIQPFPMCCGASIATGWSDVPNANGRCALANMTAAEVLKVVEEHATNERRGMITAILNQAQNPGWMKYLLAGGWELTFVTTNPNHQNTHILYLWAKDLSGTNHTDKKLITTGIKTLNVLEQLKAEAEGLVQPPLIPSDSNTKKPVKRRLTPVALRPKKATA